MPRSSPPLCGRVSSALNWSAFGRPSVVLKREIAVIAVHLREAGGVCVPGIREVVALRLRARALAVFLAVAEVDVPDGDLRGLAAVPVLVLIGSAGQLSVDDDEPNL